MSYENGPLTIIVLQMIKKTNRIVVAVIDTTHDAGMWKTKTLVVDTTCIHT